MELSDLLNHTGEWLRGDGPQSDIVISSRIRLARNLADFPFVTRMDGVDRRRLVELVEQELLGEPAFSDVTCFHLPDLGDIDRQLLVERHLISRELSETEGARAAMIDSTESFSLMVNEEDHLRLQVMQSGFDLENAWQRANELDDTIESHVAFAFDEKLGYLTACPTNVGTGVRVSVMLHLPALVITREIERVFRGLERINLAVRGLYGEGSQALGDFYQISNQITLGRTENELMSRLSEVVEVIIDYEKKARKTLLQEGRSMFHDRISRAYGILQAAQTISSEETMHHLSGVRLGLDLGLIEGINTVTVNQLFLGILPAHLQKRAGETLDAADRDVQRAKYLREKLGHA